MFKYILSELSYQYIFLRVPVFLSQGCNMELMQPAIAVATLAATILTEVASTS